MSNACSYFTSVNEIAKLSHPILIFQYLKRIIHTFQNAIFVHKISSSVFQQMIYFTIVG